MTAPRLETVWPLVLGFVGMLGFSGTLPASRVAVPVLGGVVVGLGRALIAAAFAGAYLRFTRAARPARGDFRFLVLTSVGVVFGFPLLSALAMRTLPASHGAVITGLIPAATALMGAWRTGERPPLAFWVACVAGMASVLIFAVVEGAGRPQAGDLLLLGAVAAAGFGYAEGAGLARRWGNGSGIRVASWTLVIASPVVACSLATVMLVGGPPDLSSASHRTWIGFGYVAIISSYFAFIPWYAGLARGGVARVGQVQLLQPVVTVVWAATLLGERVSGRTVLAALLVMACAAAAVFTRTTHGHAAAAARSGVKLDAKTSMC